MEPNRPNPPLSDYDMIARVNYHPAVFCIAGKENEVEQDILVGGRLKSDYGRVMRVWRGSGSYESRVNRLRTNGLLNSTTAPFDLAFDNLMGEGGRDWFWGAGRDRVANERFK